MLAFERNVAAYRLEKRPQHETHGLGIFDGTAVPDLEQGVRQILGHAFVFDMFCLQTTN
jgi:hypothetical protein